MRRPAIAPVQHPLSGSVECVVQAWVLFYEFTNVDTKYWGLPTGASARAHKKLASVQAELRKVRTQIAELAASMDEPPEPSAPTSGTQDSEESAAEGDGEDKGDDEDGDERPKKKRRKSDEGAKADAERRLAMSRLKERERRLYNDQKAAQNDVRDCPLDL